MRTFAATSILPKDTTSRAASDLGSLSEEVLWEVDALILRIRADPRAEGAHLKGTFHCRWSAYAPGNRRVLYRIEGSKNKERVVILAIPPRKAAYPRSHH